MAATKHLLRGGSKAAYDVNCPGAAALRAKVPESEAGEAAVKGMTRDEVHAGYAAGTSMRTWVTADDIAAMAVFLASPAAARVSGQVIAVDGHTETPDPKV